MHGARVYECIWHAFVILKLVLGLEYPLPGLEEHLEPQGGLPLHRHTVGEDISVLDQ